MVSDPEIVSFLTTYWAQHIARLLVPHAGSGKYFTLDSFVDFGTVYIYICIICLFKAKFHYASWFELKFGLSSSLLAEN